MAFENLSLPFDNYYKFFTVLGIFLTALGMYILFSIGISAPYEFAEIKSKVEQYRIELDRIDRIDRKLNAFTEEIDAATRSGVPISEDMKDRAKELIKTVESERDRTDSLYLAASEAMNRSEALTMKMDTIKYTSRYLVILGSFFTFVYGYFWFTRTQIPLDKQAHRKRKKN